MKNKILTLIIGILIGAIITTAGFLIYNNAKGNNRNGMPSGEPPQISTDMKGNSGDQASDSNRQMPPEMPGQQKNTQGQSSSSNEQTPPTMPSGEQNKNQGNNQGTAPQVPSSQTDNSANNS